MTIKQLFPLMIDKHRRWLGAVFISSYRALNDKQSPPKIKEDEFEVYDYPDSFLELRKKRLVKRFVKKNPDAIVEKPKRQRIQKGFAQLVNPDSTKV